MYQSHLDFYNFPTLPRWQCYPKPCNSIVPTNHQKFQDGCSPLSNNSQSNFWHFSLMLPRRASPQLWGCEGTRGPVKCHLYEVEGQLFVLSFFCICVYLYFLCFFTLKYSSKKSLSQGPLMPGRLRWYKVESGCNGMGAALEAKLTSKAKGPVPLFCVFADCFPLVIPNTQGEQAMV